MFHKIKLHGPLQMNRNFLHVLVVNVHIIARNVRYGINKIDIYNNKHTQYVLTTTKVIATEKKHIQTLYLFIFIKKGRIVHVTYDFLNI